MFGREPQEFESFEQYKQYVHETRPELVRQEVQRNVFGLPVRKTDPLIRFTDEEMDKLGVPLHFRDACTHHYVPLQKCRNEHNYAMWHCNDERIRLERCYYKRTLATTHKSTQLWQLEKKIKEINALIEK
jgi:NADH dehydrogenase (ubiquinone) 1 beta subcomplex subunit 7